MDRYERGVRDEIEGLRDALADVSARLAALEGGRAGGEAPVMPRGLPDDVALAAPGGAPSSSLFTFVTGISFSSSSGSSGVSAVLVATTAEVELAGRVVSSSGASLMAFVPEEI